MKSVLSRRRYNVMHELDTKAAEALILDRGSINPLAQVWL